MNEVLLKAEGIYKSFGATKAVVDFHIEVCRGTIHGLIGENGSGKSTFSSIVAGIQQRDSGRLLLRGEDYAPTSSVDAAKQGVSLIVQEIGTIGSIPVSANIFLNEERRFVKHGCIDYNTMNAEAKKILSQIGGEHIDPQAITGTLNLEDRKLVEIARGMYSEPELLIIDETSNALGGLGLSFLFAQGAFDLSFGSVVCFASLLAAKAVEVTGVDLLIFVIPFVVCIGIGILNGLLYSRVGLVVFIQTLGVSFLLKGTFTTLLGPIGHIKVPKVLNFFDSLPFTLAFTIVATVFVGWLFSYTAFGKHCRMVGSGQEATVQSGVDIRKTKLLAFVAAGVTGGVISLLSMARGGQVSTSTASNFEFNVMIALTLGGMPSEGGTGAKLRSVFIGCFIVSVLTNGMVLLGIDGRMQEVIKGLIFVLVLIMTSRLKEKSATM